MFKPGVSGNPAGRPPKKYAWKDILNSMLGASKIEVTLRFPPDAKRRRPKRIVKLDVADKRSFRHAITAREIELALGGDTDAIKDLLDRDLGKPQQYIDHTTLDEPIKMIYNLEGADPDELRKIRELLQKGKASVSDDGK